MQQQFPIFLLKQRYNEPSGKDARKQFNANGLRPKG